jgi:transitional endoplasmic reticulum ATPase
MGGSLCNTTTNFFSLFDDPNKAARVLYAQYWQRKLKDNKDVSFPDSLVTEIAEETERFSFAYLKEALYALLPISPAL